jgi:hypothetical protein
VFLRPAPERASFIWRANLKTVFIDPEVLAQRLLVAAEVYDKDAADHAETPSLHAQFKRQAEESREWAEVLSRVVVVGWEGAQLSVSCEG